MKWLRERIQSIRARVPTVLDSDPFVEFSDDGNVVRIVNGNEQLTLHLSRHVRLIGGQLLDVAREIERRNERKYEVSGE